MAEKADIRELATAAWRLEKWLDNLHTERKQAAKSALRGIKKYLTASGVEILDPTGSKFDPGLAIEVINNESETSDESELMIIETLSPYIYQNGQLVQRARVIIGTMIKNKQAEKSGSVQEDTDASGAVQAAGSPEKEPGSLQISGAETEIRKKDVERILSYAKIL